MRFLRRMWLGDAEDRASGKSKTPAELQPTTEILSMPLVNDHGLNAQRSTMRTIWHSLAWKEWHEHKWKLAALTAVLCGVNALLLLNGPIVQTAFL